MEFEVRYRDYLFKHTDSPRPDRNENRYQEHYHTTYELLYFVRGDADFMLKHTLYKLKPGSLLVIKPGEYHNVVFNSDAPYERYVIRFSPLAIYPSVRKQLEKAEPVYYIEGTTLATVFDRMDVHLHWVHKDVQLSACIGSMNIIIAHLISAENLIQKADYVNDDLKTIVEYIEAHLTEIHSAEQVGRALHMSKSALYKTFSSQFGTPIMTYVRTQKCMIARNLLGEGASATEVCEQLGFNHYTSFYRDYRAVFGRSPSDEGRT